MLAVSEERNPCTDSCHRWDSSDGSIVAWELSSSSTPFWDTGFEREGGSCFGLVESTPREAEALSNPLSMMLRDGRDLSVVPPCEKGWSEEELSKLFHFSKVLGMPVEGHEVKILALIKKLKLRTGSSTLCKRRLNDIEKRKLIKGVVRNQKPDLVAFQRRRKILEELGAIHGLWEDPWCIEGDFNALRFPEERRNAFRLTAEMRRFSEVIGELGLRDFPLAGGPFTWIGGLNSQTASRLDRFLISTNGRPLFCHHVIYSSSSEGFKDLVGSWWNGYSVEGYSSHCIAKKLKALKKDLKNWNKEVVGNVSFNRVEAFSRLQCWEAKENENSLTPGEVEAKKLTLRTIRNGPFWKKLLGNKSQEKSG
ncbi:hypothetical protein CK203_050638 [Vitis vinifera]|uniref:Endonuclease/exonuclease/phosphatase domain-containing protein n=1 Tax=Vitis vinifera TaxID=29760 RepID=A0A438GKC1_VITVI|nr:hypothetical protein CK203_050638 [Vitis vinifera]